jgi:hypothetical protein
MQGTISDALVVIGACLVVALFAIAVIILRPARRRHRHRKRHSHRPKIDLFADKASDPAATTDA